jgi:toxin-antitoxin system, toxin component, Txe/YoeB family
MQISFTPAAFADYVGWQNEDRKTVNRINKLLYDIMRNPFEGLGKPEALKHDLKGYWSRRIDDRNRLVYFVDAEGNIVVTQCKEHY